MEWDFKSCGGQQKETAVVLAAEKIVGSPLPSMFDTYIPALLVKREISYPLQFIPDWTITLWHVTAPSSSTQIDFLQAPSINNVD